VEAARPATADDVPRLAELARAAIAELVDVRGGAVWAAREARREPIEDGFAAALADERRRVLVGTIDDVIVGYAAAHVEALHDGSSLGVVDDVFVEAAARAVGVGEALHDDLVAWCAARGCRGVDAMALPGQRETKNFFEEAGFTARQLVMHRSLTEGPA
jgi:GNAT superfamily N-acetyltransferase